MFRVEVLRCVTNYIGQEPMLDQLIHSDSARLLIDCLCAADEPMILKTTIVELVLASRRYAELTDMYIDRGVLDW